MKIQNMLRTTACVAALALGLSAGAAVAAAPGANTTAPGVINVSVNGNNGNVTVNSQMPYVNDSVNITAANAFSFDQSNRFQTVGTWTGDGNDIDRVAAFNGPGSINATSGYQSTNPYSVGLSTTTVSLTASDNGGLQQSQHWDQNQAGSFTQDQWSKQRTTQLTAGGAYNYDLSVVGASIAPSLGSFPAGSLPAYTFDANVSAASGSSSLLFAPGNGNQGLSNQSDHSHYTGVSLNGQLDYTGAPVGNFTAHSVNSTTLVVQNTAGQTLITGTVQ